MCVVLCSGEQAYSNWVVGLVFFLGLVLGVLLHRFVLPLILNSWNWVKQKLADGPERDRSSVQENDASTEKVHLNSRSSSPVPDG